MDKELQKMFEESGWKYWDLREESGAVDPSIFDPRVGRLVTALQGRLKAPYGISVVEDYTHKPRDGRTLANLTIYESQGDRPVDVASVSVQQGGHVGYNDFTSGKQLEGILQGLKFE